MSDLRLLIWEPSIYRSELECRGDGCDYNIPPNSPFFIYQGEIKFLLPHAGTEQAWSVRCAECGLREFMQIEFRGMFREAIKEWTLPTEHEIPLKTSIRALVREELQQILREEAYDPNGPFSPAP